ncbi:alpha/beta fold hydrolase [Nonomuraea rhizosphaerae]|uniref:alpha/beta fold hydrolase n=1 Tax=Nonomuraea rhizosphaerae TaxID=2665663 RepID=UPI001FEC0157|nr:alpha/beta fold hydrolase [Nonomuraea rhizosphaerae]
MELDGTIYYEVRGTGPYLLISQSGEGDADRSADLVDQLVTDHTVITYDRRGLSRSARSERTEVERHADDVLRLIDHVTGGEPVPMLGLSFGATIGLHLAGSGRLSRLIAHEPVAPWLLPPDECAAHKEELAEGQEIYRRDGLPAVLKEIGRTLGIDVATQATEPDLTSFPMTPQRVANFGYFVEHDWSAIIDDHLDPAALKDAPIVPIAGITTPRTIFDYRCSEELARLLGVELIHFPGGHNGNLTHPRAYARKLRELLDQ